MKRILLNLFIGIIIVGCTTDEGLYVLVSEDFVDIEASGGEKRISIMTEADWTVEYEADWLLVRQHKDLIRILVDENESESPRKTTIRILFEGEKQASEIVVSQSGVTFSVGDNIFSVPSKESNFTVSIHSNISVSINNELDWCIAELMDKDLFISVDRNYEDKRREGIIELRAGNIVNKITISQDSCLWYDSFRMQFVEGGKFYMGAQTVWVDSVNYDENAFTIESPVHEVILNDFYICSVEVTQHQWMAAMGSNPSQVQGDKLPVTDVSWDEAIEFINVLNMKTGLNYRLPTEAEWEYAARGGCMTNSSLYSGSSVLSASGWYYSNSSSVVHDVAGKYPNELGLYDMSGNVREWCLDWMEYYTSNSAKNPIGPSEGDLKINRGGSWATPSVNCRNTYRHADSPTSAASDLGFRLVLPID